jgi:hypothetical protein
MGEEIGVGEGDACYLPIHAILVCLILFLDI